MIGKALKKGSSLISGMAKVHPETRMQWYMLEMLEFFCFWEVVPPQYNSPVNDEAPQKSLPF